ncbi:MAG TPA: ROK family protein [Verrucomicrobiae bacterium]|nr:ROK family protein [Verrucomicrobiae bacterium]
MTSKRYTIGVDLGGTNLRIAAHSEGRNFLDSISLPTRLQAGRDAVVQDMCGAVQQFRKKFSDWALAGVGIGTPGPLELPIGRLRKLPNFPGWDGFNLREAVESRIGMKVSLEVDANVAALAESKFGQGKTLGLDSMYMLTLGTGVGNGIILDGKVFHGMSGMAGEGGHSTVWPNGPRCGCGNHGCVEVFASASAVHRMARELIAQGGSPGLAALEKSNPFFAARDVAELAAAGDPGARKVFENVGEALGITLAAMINTLNLPLYVVGGGMTNAWALFSPRLFAELESRSYVYCLNNGKVDEFGYQARMTHVVPAELGAEAGLLGACLLPLTEAAS